MAQLFDGQAGQFEGDEVLVVLTCPGAKGARGGVADVVDQFEAAAFAEEFSLVRSPGVVDAGERGVQGDDEFGPELIDQGEQMPGLGFGCGLLPRAEINALVGPIEVPTVTGNIF